MTTKRELRARKIIARLQQKCFSGKKLNKKESDMYGRIIQIILQERLKENQRC